MASISAPERELCCRFITAFPFSLVFGGLEHQCIEAINALRNLGVSAEFLDWYNRDEQFDIVHLFGAWHGYYELSREVSERCPFVVSALAGGRSVSRLRTLGGNLFSLGGRLLGQSTLRERTREILNMSGRVICSNELEKSFFCGHFGLKEEKVLVIPNGVPDTRFNARPEMFADRYNFKDYVLYVGNIVPRKNPVLLARVLKKEGIPGVFVATPVYSEKVYLNEFTKVVESAPNLLWVKGLDYHDPVLDSAYAGAKVFCLPSAIETQPVAALEAMAAGAPVILGDYPYAYQSPFEETVKCIPNDLNALARCLNNMFYAPKAPRTQLPKSYRWDNIAIELLNLYREVRGGPRI